jgi:hypothetical protein
LSARLARDGDDGVEVCARGLADGTPGDVRAHGGVLGVTEHAVEVIAEQFLALLAVHFTKPSNTT